MVAGYFLKCLIFEKNMRKKYLRKLSLTGSFQPLDCTVPLLEWLLFRIPKKAITYHHHHVRWPQINASILRRRRRRDRSRRLLKWNYNQRFFLFVQTMRLPLVRILIGNGRLLNSNRRVTQVVVTPFLLHSGQPCFLPSREFRKLHKWT